MSWFSSLFKRKSSAPANDRYVMRLVVCNEAYTIDEFDLRFKRDTDRNDLPEGKAYGGFITCTLSGMPGNGLLGWGADNRRNETGEIRIYEKDKPDENAVFALRCVDANCIRFQRTVDRASDTHSMVILFAARLLRFVDEEFENEWH
ncbi:MAG: type VI secretion system tube protein TssD [Bacteroides uniformis]|jgi:hypothetical protein